MYVVLTRNKDGNVILPGPEQSIENNYAPETRLLTSYCTVRVVRKKEGKNTHVHYLASPAEMKYGERPSAPHISHMVDT